MKQWYVQFPAVPPEPVTDDKGQPIDPSLPAGGSPVPPAQLCFSAEEDDEVVAPTEEPAPHLTAVTAPPSAVAVPATALESAAPATTGAKKA